MSPRETPANPQRRHHGPAWATRRSNSARPGSSRWPTTTNSSSSNRQKPSQVRLGGGSVVHAWVFRQMICGSTSIIGRPRPLTRHQRSGDEFPTRRNPWKSPTSQGIGRFPQSGRSGDSCAPPRDLVFQVEYPVPNLQLTQFASADFARAWAMSGLTPMSVGDLSVHGGTSRSHLIF